MNASRNPPRTHADTVFDRASHQHGVIMTASAEVLPEVDTSWRRCLEEFKLDPAQDYQTIVHDGTHLKDLQSEHEELVQIARAEMDALYEQIAGSGYALLLADTHGVILCEKVDPTLERMFSQAGLIVGAEWSEKREGTNGIGTCALEARPITIHQSDHFRTRHSNLSCSAAPIHDHLGRVIAVLDASCVGSRGTRETQLHTVALVQASARLIEKCLFLRRHRGESLLRFHHRPEFIDLLHDGAIAVDGEGTILATDMTGLKLLGAGSHKDVVGRSIADIFDATYEELLAAKGAARRAIWQLRDNVYGRRYYASLVECSDQATPLPLEPTIASSRAIVHVARDASGSTLSLEDLAGEDPQMLRNLRNARRIADRNVSVLIRGATGTGKEAFAKALHLASNRAKQPFIAVNCAAIPESLIESELFGYGEGAFTGARRQGMRGRIAQSSGGTLFLDEIGDMPLSLQTRLLRVLEEHEVLPLGSEELVKVDLRVICASHRNLRELLARGEFREDLYYRLNGITIELPTLAARRDRETLVRRCIARECGGNDSASIESAALKQLLNYDWPGNVRELRNAIRTALAICDGGVIRRCDLPAEIRQYSRSVGAKSRGYARPAPTLASGEMPASFESAEKQVLLQAIEQNNWVMARVAAQLRISRNTLYRKIKSHSIPLTRP